VASLKWESIVAISLSICVVSGIAWTSLGQQPAPHAPPRVQPHPSASVSAPDPLSSGAIASSAPSSQPGPPAAIVAEAAAALEALRAKLNAGDDATHECCVAEKVLAKRATEASQDEKTTLATCKERMTEACDFDALGEKLNQPGVEVTSDCTRVSNDLVSRATAPTAEERAKLAKCLRRLSAGLNAGGGDIASEVLRSIGQVVVS